MASGLKDWRPADQKTILLAFLVLDVSAVTSEMPGRSMREETGGLGPSMVGKLQLEGRFVSRWLWDLGRHEAFSFTDVCLVLMRAWGVVGT